MRLRTLSTQAWPAGRGMTLIELLLVMALLGLLLGAGVGMLASLDLGQRATLGAVQNAIRAARNSALARRAPARVRVDAQAGVLRAEVLEVVGTWHFEGDLSGAQGLVGSNLGAVFVEDGWIGQALSFAGQAGAGAQFPVQDDASWDFQHGFRLECALRVDGPGSGRVLDVGGLFGLELLAGGALGAWFVPAQVDASGSLRGSGRQVVQTAEGALPGGRWVRVRFEYDRRVSRLLLDGIELARAEVDLPVWRMEGPLACGDGRRALNVALDDLVIGAVTAGQELALPAGVRFVGAPVVLAFDAGGNLEREVHRGPAEFQLEFEDGRRAALRVGVYGTVEAGPAR